MVTHALYSFGCDKSEELIAAGVTDPARTYKGSTDERKGGGSGQVGVVREASDHALASIATSESGMAGSTNGFHVSSNHTAVFAALATFISIMVDFGPSQTGNIAIWDFLLTLDRSA